MRWQGAWTRCPLTRAKAYEGAQYFGGGAGTAVRKGDAALAERFNRAIEPIRPNGKYQQV